METKERIIETGRAILLEEGLRAVTTNAIVKRARISKKTLYNLFPNKDMLVETIVLSFMEKQLAQWDAILERDASAMDRILASLEFVSEFMPRVQTHLISQIERVAPALWKRIDAVRMQRLEKLKTLLAEAQAEGAVRSDIDPDVWILLLMGTVRSVLTPKTLFETGYTLPKLVETIRRIYYEGLLTQKGRDYVKHKQKESP